MHVKEAVNKPEAAEKQEDDSNSDSYKKQLMDQLDKKVEEKSKFLILWGSRKYPFPSSTKLKDVKYGCLVCTPSLEFPVFPFKNLAFA